MSSVTLQILYPSSVLWHIKPDYFFGSKIIYFREKQHIKMQIFRLATGCNKIHQIPHVIFGTKSQVFFKLCITLQCHEAYLFCTFSSKALYALEKRSSSKCKFLYTRLCHFSSHESFFLNFASSFSVMTHNSYEIFELKHYLLWTKWAQQSTILQTVECSNESSPNSSCYFWNHQIGVYSNLASLFSVMKNNSSIFL